MTLHTTAVCRLLTDHVTRLVTAMGIAATIECAHTQATDEAAAYTITITTDDSRLLIGAGGTHLAALEHLVRCVVRHQSDYHERINLDINGYRAQRIQTLHRLATDTAARAVKLGRTVALRPMPSPDRRAIHTALAAHPDVKTESLGEGGKRRVVVKPVFLS